MHTPLSVVFTQVSEEIRPVELFPVFRETRQPQERLLAFLALVSPGLVLPQVGLLVLLQPPRGLEPGPAVLEHAALEQLLHQGVGVGHVAIEVVLTLEGLRAVRAGVASLVAVTGGDVLLEELVLHERLLRPAQVAGEPLGVCPVGQDVVPVAVLREGPLSGTQRAHDARAAVGLEVLVQVGLGLEDLVACVASVGSDVAVAITPVLLQL